MIQAIRIPSPAAPHVLRALCSITLALACAAPQASAQTQVLPAGAGVSQPLQQNEGNSGFHLPSRQAPSRVLTVYRGADLKIQAPGMTIRKLAYRRDGARATTHRAHRFKTSIFMSSRGVALPSSIRDDSFAAAHGVDRVKVLDGKLVDWPAVSKPANPPAPFLSPIQLDTPFVLAPGANLCIEVQCESTSSGPENHYWYVDAELFDRSAIVGSSRNLGRGCPFGNQLRVEAPPIDGESALESWVWTRATRPSRSYLAVANTSGTYMGRSLPIDLVGTTACRLYVAPIHVMSAISGTDTRGTARFRVPITTRDLALVGMKLRFQAFVEDPAAGGAGLRSSSYVEATLGKIGAPLPARTLYDSASATDDVPTASRDLGLVVQIQS